MTSITRNKKKGKQEKMSSAQDALLTSLVDRIWVPVWELFQHIGRHCFDTTGPRLLREQKSEIASLEHQLQTLQDETKSKKLQERLDYIRSQQPLPIILSEIQAKLYSYKHPEASVDFQRLWRYLTAKMIEQFSSEAHLTCLLQDLLQSYLVDYFRLYYENAQAMGFARQLSHTPLISVQQFAHTFFSTLSNSVCYQPELVDISLDKPDQNKNALVFRSLVEQNVKKTLFQLIPWASLQKMTRQGQPPQPHLASPVPMVPPPVLTSPLKDPRIDQLMHALQQKSENEMQLQRRLDSLTSQMHLSTFLPQHHSLPQSLSQPLPPPVSLPTQPHPFSSGTNVAKPTHTSNWLETLEPETKTSRPNTDWDSQMSEIPLVDEDVEDEDEPVAPIAQVTSPSAGDKSTATDTSSKQQSTTSMLDQLRKEEEDFSTQVQQQTNLTVE
jgi:hypothetical protein